MTALLTAGPRAGDRCISVKQPFPWLILDGLKRVENRTWKTDYRGRIWLHASGRLACKSWHQIADVPETPIDQSIERHGILLPALSSLVLGAIVGSVQLVDCVPYGQLPDEYRSGLANGPICWILDDPQPLLMPISCNGRLGLWTWR